MMKKTILKLSLTYITLLAAFTLLLTATFAIPTRLVRGYVAESAQQIIDEGLWFKPMGFYLFQIDNMTDCLMMHISAYADSDHPLRAAMLAENAKAYDKDFTQAYTNAAATTLAVAEKGRTAFADKNYYARYWHGYQVVLRPLLCIMDYGQIRTLNYVLLTLLTIVVTLFLHIRGGKAWSFTFVAMLLLSNAMIIPLAMQFSTCFYIALTAMLLFLLKPHLTGQPDRQLIIFFTVGAVTAYLDFLTTPLLTLGMPLMAMAATTKRNNITTANIGRNSLSWACGYASLWASKWVLTWALTGYNALTDAVENAKLRIGNTIVFGGEEMSMSQFFDIINAKISSFISPLFILLILLSLISVVVFYLWRNRAYRSANGWLLLIAAMPLLWFAVMKNHSLQHIFFTWRDFMLTLWCFMLLIVRNHEMKKQKTLNTL